MDLTRYQRQMIVPEIGKKGQTLLKKKTILIIGGGGLGSTSSELFTRMGIGKIVLVDFDDIQESNLHRTSVFSEDDIGKPKATILAQKLKTINSKTIIMPLNQKITKENIELFIQNIDLIIDATDNMHTRFLINNMSIKKNIPWVYAGVYSTVGMVMGIIPRKTPCLNCIANTISQHNNEIPVVGNLPFITAGIQCTEALKILLGNKPAGLIIYDIWKQIFDCLLIQKNPKCKICGEKQM